ncbi:MAG: Smr/MutS family protein [Desulfamplus sp.]|nr:Smr/MutS family protein [Desulfamplus sp.]
MSKKNISKRNIYKKRAESYTRRKNRNGIVVFANDEDISSLFIKRDSCCSGRKSSSFETTSLTKDKPAGFFEDNDTSAQEDNTLVRIESFCLESNKGSSQKRRVFRRDRHGLPIIDGQGSISKMFIQAEKTVSKQKDSGLIHEDEDFSELVETALMGKNRDAMMREKSDRPLPKPVPLKNRLKRYPPPQDKIDLHGHTATEAQSRTESYLRSCWRNGVFTVQIIVGRGIHSTYGPVLPNVVEDLLARLKREGVIMWFEWDKRTKSQSGAVIVYLKQFT